MTTDNVIALFTDLVGSTEFQSSVTPEISYEVRRNHFSALGKAVAKTGCPPGTTLEAPSADGPRLEDFRTPKAVATHRVVTIPPKGLASWREPVQRVQARVGRGDDAAGVRGEALPCIRLFGSSKTNPRLARSCG